MELLNDIFEYLERFIKPKKYSLINKFCRDIYFRKNGVSITMYDNYRHFKICENYKIKIMELRLSDSIISGLKKVADNVTHICCYIIHIKELETILNLFPNLVKLKYIGRLSIDLLVKYPKYRQY